MNANDDDILGFLDDAESESFAAGSWKILVVDDDPEVHAATRIALRTERICGRGVVLLHAHSAREAEFLLQQTPDVAVILLDVVMEAHDSGLRFVETVRDKLANARVRIILRTGQPGYAPELDVVRRYDINDYKTKSELTQVRLVTAVTAAIRAYAHLAMLERHQVGLGLIVRASRDLVRRTGVESFAEGVLTQLGALLDAPCNGIVCAYRHSDDFDEAASPIERFTIIGAAGAHASLLSGSLSSVPDAAVTEAILRCVDRQENVFTPEYAVLYVAAEARDRGRLMEGAIFLATGRPLDAEHRALVDVFAENIATAFANVALFEHLEFLAYHDGSTGLLNREGMLGAIAVAQLLPPAERPKLVLAEVTDFARIGGCAPLLSHDDGGAFPSAVARRLRRHAKSSVVGRVGDDLYALLTPGFDPEALANAFARPVSVDVSEPSERGVDLHSTPPGLDSQSVVVRNVVGYAEIGDDAPQASLRDASLALQSAKVDGAAWARFAPSMDASASARRQLLRRLRSDLAIHGLTVWFQPQIDLATDAVAGMEALVRWIGDDGKPVSTPDVFVALAEEGGLIVELGRMVLTSSCAAIASVRARGLSVPRVAVNVSPQQFRNQQFVSDVRGALAASRLAGSDLELEITEGVTVNDPGKASDIMAELRADGVRFAIDDFGTGHSSLTQLRRLPFDVLKIDRSFIREFDGPAQPLVHSVLALANAMGLETVAEGVETVAHMDALRGLGCRISQGFYHARPMPLPALLEWLAARGSARA